MTDDFETTRQFADELMELRGRLAELEAWKAEHRWDAQALRHSEKRFRTLTEKSPVGVYFVEEGLFKYVNPKMAEIFGYAVDELAGQEMVRSLVHDEDWPKVRESLTTKPPREEPPFTYQFRGIRKNGELIHVEVYGSRMEYRGRSTIIGTLLDVTQRVHAEAGLEKELQKFQALYDLATAMTASHSLDENLSLVVDKSRDLLHCDTSYIALRDEQAGDVYMHTLSGIRTEAFKKLRIPYGAGLGGKVAATGKGFIIKDYFQEVGPVVHDVVREEGLISGVAVPVQIGDKNLGILYVFNRRVTSFSKSDLDTLSLLGNLAAVEITRRRTAAELLQAREELEKRVAERTWELIQINEKLHMEVAHRQRTERELRRSEERYRTLVEESFDGILIHRSGEIIFANSRLYEMLGYEPGSLTGLILWDLCHAEDRTIARKLALARMQGEKVPARYELRLVRNDQTTFDVEISARLVEFEGGKRTQVWIKDITERKRAEEALRTSEEKYRLVVQNASDAIFVVQDGELRLMNPRTREIMGYSEPELMSRPFLEFVHPEDREYTWQRQQQRLRGENPPPDHPVRIICRDGSTRWLELNAVRINWGEKTATLNFASDVTAKRRIEQELQKIEKLESIGILAGGIAHDFNNIITAILGNISIAKMCLPHRNEIFARLSEAEKACMHAQGLTQQLLTFAKGGAPIRKLAALSDMIRDACQFALMGSNVKCEFAFADNLWAVEVDGGQINQVIYNMLINAHHAMPEGGTVVVSAENVRISPEDALPVDPGNYLKIQIKDHGTGIPKKLLSKIFDPYFTTKTKGSGLGLATSFSIMKNHGGWISVESEVGAGTTFCLYVPACDEMELQVIGDESRPSVGQGKILVMDDEPFIRDLAKEMLSLLGFEVVVARDGEEVIELYQEAKQSSQPFDAVIMDLTVPGGMGGSEAMRILKGIDPSVRAIVSSGYSNDPIMAEYRQYGFAGVVAKPYGVKELSDTLNRVLTCTSTGEDQEELSCNTTSAIPT